MLKMRLQMISERSMKDGMHANEQLSRLQSVIAEQDERIDDLCIASLG